ncbi:MAG: hypothetical protein FJ304_25330 [Planctomycetes bacterium]|nr:hypothetical protein [Planctomycetota bacterium]
MRTVAAVVAFALVVSGLRAQPGSPPPPAPLPPGTAVSNPVPLGGAPEPLALTGGKTVSQPLQPVGPGPADPPKDEQPKDPKPPEPVEPAAPELKPTPDKPAKPAHGPLGPAWDDWELLYWWPKPQPVPVLAVGPNTFLGGTHVDSQPSAGARFTFGRALNTPETFGYEVVYFFLGTRTFHQSLRDFSGGGTPEFGLPYTNATTGAREVLALAQPGVAHSYLNASTSVRVQGWEINTLANVVDEKYIKLNALLGYRYFMANEGIRLEQTRFGVADGSVTRTADQFDAHNRFHGGQLGLHADMRRGFVFCELSAKVAFGKTYEVVKHEGATVFHPFGISGPVTRAYGGGGLYVQPSSAGRTAHGSFAVLPEATIKFGFRLGDAGRVYLGYNVIYLSDAVRPGDQIERVLNPAQVPLVSGGPPVFGDRPLRLLNRSDFWAQGLTIGLETRF